jgi:hypothetical protein
LREVFVNAVSSLEEPVGKEVRHPWTVTFSSVEPVSSWSSPAVGPHLEQTRLAYGVTNVEWFLEEVAFRFRVATAVSHEL